MDFDGKRILITGGSSGIGLATAHKFLQAGAQVAIVSRHPERLSQAAAELKQASNGREGVVAAYAADVSDADQINAVVESAAAEIGPPDIVINSAGVAHPGYVQELDLEIFRWMMDVNYYGTVYTNHAVLPLMLARGSGHIVNIASLAGILNVFGYSAYGASKYAVRGYSEALRAEMKPHGIDVSVVYPPDTETPQLTYENQYKPPETKAISSTGGALAPQIVAEEIYQGVRRKKFIILPGFESKFLYWAARILGTLAYPILDYLASTAHTKEKL